MEEKRGVLEVLKQGDGVGDGNDSPRREFSYTAQRIGFPIFGESHDETEDFRRESLAEATRASLEIYSLVRLNMNEAGLNTFLSKSSRFVTQNTVKTQHRDIFFEQMKHLGPEDFKDLDYIIRVFNGEQPDGTYIANDLHEKPDVFKEYIHRTRFLVNHHGVQNSLMDVSVYSDEPMEGISRIYRDEFMATRAEIDEIYHFLLQELTSFERNMIFFFFKYYAQITKRPRNPQGAFISDLATVVNPETADRTLSKLYSFVTHGNETFDRNAPMNQLNRILSLHHRMELSISNLIEARMRFSHVMVEDFDIKNAKMFTEFDDSERKEELAAAAWNIAGILNKSQYHGFYARLGRFKMTYTDCSDRPGKTFLRDIESRYPEKTSKVLIPILERCGRDLSVEALNSCRLRQEMYGKIPKRQLELTSPSNLQDFVKSYPSNRTVFYSNLPRGADSETVQIALRKVGKIKQVVHYVGEQDERKLDKLFKHKLSSNTTNKARHEVGKELRKFNAQYCAVEYSSEEDWKVAMQTAVRVFGVIATSGSEMRPIFGLPCEKMKTLVLYKVPFATPVESLLETVRELMPEEIQMEIQTKAPRGLLVFDDRMELKFNNYTQAAIVAERLHEYLDKEEERPFEITWRFPRQHVF